VIGSGPDAYDALVLRAASVSVWVNPQILGWHAYEGGSSDLNKEFVRRAYEIWDHAASRATSGSPTTRETRVDIVTSLKRATEQRVRLLAETYNVAQLPLSEKPAGRLEALAYLDVVRPLMLERLNEIRNVVEHEDAVPPDDTRCGELIEFSWYFLRSTDTLVRAVCDLFLLQPTEEANPEHWIEVKVTLPVWRFDLRGWLDESLVSTTPVDGWLKLVSEATSAAPPSQAGAPTPTKSRYVVGSLRGPGPRLAELLRVYFALGY
jgi:hypothetical protein